MPNVNIGTGNIQKIRLLESSEPATPPAGYVYTWVGVDKNLYVKDDAGLVSNLINQSVSYVLLRDEKSQNTMGGTSVTNTWTKRTVLEILDDDNICSVTSSQITLPAGIYDCKIACPARQANGHQARLYNTTSAAMLLLGTSEYASTGSSFDYNDKSHITGRFTLAVESVLEIQHNVESGYGTSGFGIASNIGTEIYTIAEFWKVG